MKITTTNNNVIFTSNIRLLNTEQFNNKLKECSNSLQKVDYPWTIETMKNGKALYTDKLMDCIAICLTNGVDSVLAHLGIRDKKRAEIDNVKEFDINNIEECLSNKIDLDDKNLHGIIFGGMQLKDDFTSGNTKQVTQIKNLLKKYEIPFSIIAARKDIHYFGKYSLFFNQDEDTLFITNNLFDSDGISGKCNYKEMEMKDNRVAYNVYIKRSGMRNINIEKRRMETSIEDYFKSQFRLVQLNKIDRFV